MFTDKSGWSVTIAYVDVKHQIASSFCVIIFHKFSHIHICKAVTDRCHLIVKHLKSFHTTRSQNHWSNKGIVTEYFSKIIFLFLKKKHKDLNPSDDLLIYDVFKGPTTNAVDELLKKTTFFKTPQQGQKFVWSIRNFNKQEYQVLHSTKTPRLVCRQSTRAIELWCSHG